MKLPGSMKRLENMKPLVERMTGSGGVVQLVPQEQPGWYRRSKSVARDGVDARPSRPA